MKNKNVMHQQRTATELQAKPCHKKINGYIFSKSLHSEKFSFHAYIINTFTPNKNTLLQLNFQF